MEIISGIARVYPGLEGLDVWNDMTNESSLCVSMAGSMSCPLDRIQPIGQSTATPSFVPTLSPIFFPIRTPLVNHTGGWWLADVATRKRIGAVGLEKGDVKDWVEMLMEEGKLRCLAYGPTSFVMMNRQRRLSSSFPDGRVV